MSFIQSEIGVNFLLSWLYQHTEGMSGVVDMGAGDCHQLKNVHRDVRNKVGIDVFQPSLEKCLSPEIQKILGDFLYYRGLISLADFPCAMFIDTIEHVEKAQAQKLLIQCQEDFQRVLIFTPLGENPQDTIDGNNYQKHLSTWFPEDLKDLGFQLVLIYPFFHTNTSGAILARWDRA